MSSAPTHTCPIQGENTEYQRTLNIETNEYSWACIWCLMAEKLTGVKAEPPTKGGNDE